jgi:hypothetical protein
MSRAIDAPREPRDHHQALAHQPRTQLARHTLPVGGGSARAHDRHPSQQESTWVTGHPQQGGRVLEPRQTRWVDRGAEGKRTSAELRQTSERPFGIPHGADDAVCTQRPLDGPRRCPGSEQSCALPGT